MSTILYSKTVVSCVFGFCGVYCIPRSSNMFFWYVCGKHIKCVREMTEFRASMTNWADAVNSEVDQARLRKKGLLSITDHHHWNQPVWQDKINSLDSDMRMHLKFSLQLGQLFVNKEVVENPALEAFKAEVKEELTSQRKKQEVLEAQINGNCDSQAR
jgi:hypothetical protein